MTLAKALDKISILVDYQLIILVDQKTLYDSNRKIALRLISFKILVVMITRRPVILTDLLFH